MYPLQFLSRPKDLALTVQIMENIKDYGTELYILSTVLIYTAKSFPMTNMDWNERSSALFQGQLSGKKFILNATWILSSLNFYKMNSRNTEMKYRIWDLCGIDEFRLLVSYGTKLIFASSSNSNLILQKSTFLSDCEPIVAQLLDLLDLAVLCHQVRGETTDINGDIAWFVKATIEN